MSNSPIPFPYRCAVPTMRQTLLCKNSSSKCAMRWPTWRGECYPPPCCSTAAGWAQSTLWYPSFKSRPFSLFVWHAFPFLSFHCTVLRGTNSLASVCTSWCQSFWIIFLWLSLSIANIDSTRKCMCFWKKNKTGNFSVDLPQELLCGWNSFQKFG